MIRVLVWKEKEPGPPGEVLHPCNKQPQVGHDLVSGAEGEGSPRYYSYYTRVLNQLRREYIILGKRKKRYKRRKVLIGACRFFRENEKKDLRLKLNKENSISNVIRKEEKLFQKGGLCFKG